MKRLPIGARFQRHLVDHPEVEKNLVRLARREKRRGTSRCSIRKLWESARHSNGKLSGMDDHFHALYSRRLMVKYPDLGGMFRTRRRRAP